MADTTNFKMQYVDISKKSLLYYKNSARSLIIPQSHKNKKIVLYKSLVSSKNSGIIVKIKSGILYK